MDQECKDNDPSKGIHAHSNSYNGTSDLQLERMNVYFNEVRVHRQKLPITVT